MDKALGALYGVAIGDALGAPFEFPRAKPKLEYTGILANQDVSVNFRFHIMIIKASSITDDTEMTLQLLKSILAKGGRYDVDTTIKGYLDWANMKNTPLGKNTRALMKGVTTVKGFRRRQTKLDTSGVQSNGSLMRCLPIAFLDDWRKISDIDVSLTNNNVINRQSSILYLSTIRYLIYGDPIEIECTPGEISKGLKAAIDGKILDVSINKGWVVHALYVAFITLFHTNSYQEGMDFIAKHFIKGDTDTLMAIAGGLLGARFGFAKMNKEKKTNANIKRVNGYFASTDRPKITPDLIRTLGTLFT